jgi:hypothetical protein
METTDILNTETPIQLSAKNNPNNMIIFIITFFLFLMCLITWIVYEFDFTEMFTSVIGLTCNIIIFMGFFYVFYLYFFGNNNSSTHDEPFKNMGMNMGMNMGQNMGQMLSDYSGKITYPKFTNMGNFSNMSNLGQNLQKYNPFKRQIALNTQQPTLTNGLTNGLANGSYDQYQLAQSYPIPDYKPQSNIQSMPNYQPVSNYQTNIPNYQPNVQNIPNYQPIGYVNQGHT